MAVPTMTDEENDMRFWSCPVKFVPNSVWEFIHIREFYKSHPSSPFPHYKNLSPRYEIAEVIFDKSIAEYKRSLK